MADTPLFHRWDGRPDGPVLVLAHSLGVSHAMWEPQIAALGEHFRILRYDLRGHGDSGLPETPWTIDDFGRDVINLLDELGLDQVAYCGLSIGGIIGIWLGQNAPERFSRLVLCNCSAAIENTAPLQARIDKIRAEGVPSIVEMVLDRWLTPPFRESHPEAEAAIRSLLLATGDEGYVHTCGALCNFDLRPGLGSMAMPSLAIYGKHDTSTPPETTKAFAAAMPDCRVEELDSAHLSNVEASAGFNRVVLEFLCEDHD
jgi:3-oxoadipate enol-lactonase